MRDAAMLGLVGAVSGAVAWGAIVGARRIGFRAEEVVAGIQLGPLPLFPGLVFGPIFGAYVAARGGGLESGRQVAYWLASGLSYLAAYHVAYHLVAGGPLGGIGGFIAAGVAAGFVGSLLLALLTMPLLRVPAVAVRLSVAVGAIAGALLPLISIDDVGGISVGPLAFFVLWQGAYAASLGPLMGAHARDAGSRR